MKKLFIWLLFHTKINNNAQTTNKEIVNQFIKTYPKYANSKLLPLKVGSYLKDIYPEFTKLGGGQSLLV